MWFGFDGSIVSMAFMFSKLYLFVTVLLFIKHFISSKNWIVLGLYLMYIFSKYFKFYSKNSLTNINNVIITNNIICVGIQNK